jgi:hypothetical protein
MKLNRLGLIGFVSLTALQAAAMARSSATAIHARGSTESQATGAARPRVLPDGTVERPSADGQPRRPPEPMAPARASQEPEASPTTPSDRLQPVQPPEWLKDEATNKAFLRAMGEYYSYRASGLQHRRRVFEWQLTSSKVIFLTVLALVASGMVFAALQFRAGLKRTQPDVRDAASEIDFSATGVKVSSPVLGLLILVISLAFFYLYLVYVYPISELV